MAEYRAILNAFALNTLTKAPNIPDYHLMVGSAEELSGLPTLVPNSYVPSQVIEMQADVSKLTDEEIAQALENNVLEVNDLNINIASIGAGIGGV